MELPWQLHRLGRNRPLLLRKFGARNWLNQPSRESSWTATKAARQFLCAYSVKCFQISDRPVGSKLSLDSVNRGWSVDTGNLWGWSYCGATIVRLTHVGKKVQVGNAGHLPHLLTILGDIRWWRHTLRLWHLEVVETSASNEIASSPSLGEGFKSTSQWVRGQPMVERWSLFRWCDQFTSLPWALWRHQISDSWWMTQCTFKLWIEALQSMFWVLVLTLLALYVPWLVHGHNQAASAQMSDVHMIISPGMCFGDDQPDRPMIGILLELSTASAASIIFSFFLFTAFGIPPAL